MTMSVHGSLHAVFRVGKPQYDLLRFDFQVGLWRDRRLPDRGCRRRCLLLLSVLREPAPGKQPDGAERSAGDVQLSLRRGSRRQPELRQLFSLRHRPVCNLLHSGGLTSASSHALTGGGWEAFTLIDHGGFVHQFTVSASRLIQSHLLPFKTTKIMSYRRTIFIMKCPPPNFVLCKKYLNFFMVYWGSRRRTNYFKSGL